jgi:hypothetical protein
VSFFGLWLSFACAFADRHKEAARPIAAVATHFTLSRRTALKNTLFMRLPPVGYFGGVLASAI